MSATRYLSAAQMAAQIIPQVLVERNLEPLLTRYVLTETSAGTAWLFAVLDAQRLPRMEAYITDETLHHISTALHGKPVLVSNNSGLRYAVLLSRLPQLPKWLDFPGWRAGLLQLGQGFNGQAVNSRWEDLGHALVAGMTGSGKSNFLRLLALQAIQEGFALALCDPDNTTFSQLLGYPGLIAPIAAHPEACEITIDATLAEITSRGRLFATATGHPDHLDAYNALSGMQPLPRVLVIVDEANGAILATGGPRGALAQKITRLVWMGRKFGVHVVLAGQTFEKAVIGPCRDQLQTRLCFRVADAHMSRIVLGKAGAERLRNPGRAWSNVWGIVQTYQAQLAALPIGDGLTTSERELVHCLITEHDGKMTLDVLIQLGFSEREARRLRSDWQQRGLAIVKPQEKNALFVNMERFTGNTYPNVQTVRAVQTVQTDPNWDNREVQS